MKLSRKIDKIINGSYPYHRDLIDWRDCALALEAEIERLKQEIDKTKTTKPKTTKPRRKNDG